MGPTALRAGSTAQRAGDGLIWKFVRVNDERVVQNRWQWTVYDDSDADGVRVDPQGNEFSVVSPTCPAG